MGMLGDLILGKRKGSYYDNSIEECNIKKRHYEQLLETARSQINPKALPKIEKYTRPQVEKFILILRNQLAKGKIVSKGMSTSPTIEDLNRALEILGLREKIEILESQVKKLQKERPA